MWLNGNAAKEGMMAKAIPSFCGMLRTPRGDFDIVREQVVSFDTAYLIGTANSTYKVSVPLYLTSDNRMYAMLDYTLYDMASEAGALCNELERHGVSQGCGYRPSRTP